MDSFQTSSFLCGFSISIPSLLPPPASFPLRLPPYALRFLRRVRDGNPLDLY